MKRLGSSSSRSPKTSSVEMWWKRLLCLRTASSRTKVPMRLVWTKGEGSLSELSLWDSAAKWTVMSWSLTRVSTSSASQISPSMRVTLLSGRPLRLSAFPA